MTKTYKFTKTNLTRFLNTERYKYSIEGFKNGILEIGSSEDRGSALMVNDKYVKTYDIKDILNAKNVEWKGDDARFFEGVDSFESGEIEVETEDEEIITIKLDEIEYFSKGYSK